MSDAAIVLGCDDRYAIALAVAIHSALDSWRSARAPRVFILDGGISSRNRQRILGIIRSHAVDVQWLEPQLPRGHGLVEVAHLSRAAYLRLLIPQLLPPEIERAVYLD